MNFPALLRQAGEASDGPDAARRLNADRASTSDFMAFLPSAGGATVMREPGRTADGAEITKCDASATKPEGGRSEDCAPGAHFLDADGSRHASKPHRPRQKRVRPH